MVLLKFPQGFTWGAITSSYQIEGACNEDCNGLSIWDTFMRRPGKIEDGENADVAVDNYHRWKQDVDIMAELGLQAYCFSVSWARVVPTGVGKVNVVGLNFYDRLVDGLLAKKITPFVMLVVVPVEEILGPPASILLAAEPFWVIRAVLQSLELGFGVRVIVGNVRPGVGFGHTQVCHQKCHRFGSHRAAAISMDGELSWLNALPGTSFGNQLFRQVGCFAFGDHPTDHKAAENIVDDV